MSQPEWAPNGNLLAAVNADGAVILVDTVTGGVRTLPALHSPALLWSRDASTLYGVTTDAAKSVLKALDLQSEVVRTVAEYSTRLDLTDEINGTVKFNPTPDGRGFVTTAQSARQDLWVLTGLR